MKQQTETERALIKALKMERRRQAQRRATKKYDKKTLIVCSAKIKRADEKAFRELCDAARTTKHAAIKGYIERAVDEGALRFW